eukprot:scaffold360211_cov63-Attheya_sp.AAC.3
MPYVNNLNLAVFPSMSKRHSALLKAHSNNVANTDTFFSAAEEDGNLGASIRADFIDTDTEDNEEPKDSKIIMSLQFADDDPPDSDDWSISKLGNDLLSDGAIRG